MRWPWVKRPLPAIPPYQPPVTQNKPKAEEGIEVSEVDTTDLTATGVHRAWRKLTGKGP